MQAVAECAAESFVFAGGEGGGDAAGVATTAHGGEPVDPLRQCLAGQRGRDFEGRDEEDELEEVAAALDDEDELVEVVGAALEVEEDVVLELVEPAPAGLYLYTLSLSEPPQISSGLPPQGITQPPSGEGTLPASSSSPQ